jgi:hypothetical protein
VITVSAHPESHCYSPTGEPCIPVAGTPMVKATLVPIRMEGSIANDVKHIWEWKDGFEEVPGCGKMPRRLLVSTNNLLMIHSNLRYG